MQSPNTPDNARETSRSIPKRTALTGTNNFDRPPRPIAELVAQPDFPQCVLGEFIDIRGYAGVVVEIVNNSIKVKSPEGNTQSFNFHRLRTLYAPVVHPEPIPAGRSEERPRPPEKPAGPPAPPREVITQPDFDAPIKPIAEFSQRPDFPKCAYGQHVDVMGFTGVVVEIVKDSIKVRSTEGVHRSYNAALMRKLNEKA